MAIRTTSGSKTAPTAVKHSGDAGSHQSEASNLLRTTIADPSGRSPSCRVTPRSEASKLAGRAFNLSTRRPLASCADTSAERCREPNAVRSFGATSVPRAYEVSYSSSKVAPLSQELLQGTVGTANTVGFSTVGPPCPCRISTERASARNKRSTCGQQEGPGLACSSKAILAEIRRDVFDGARSSVDRHSPGQAHSKPTLVSLPATSRRPSTCRVLVRSVVRGQVVPLDRRRRGSVP